MVSSYTKKMWIGKHECTDKGKTCDFGEWSKQWVTRKPIFNKDFKKIRTDIRVTKYRTCKNCKCRDVINDYFSR